MRRGKRLLFNDETSFSRVHSLEVHSLLMSRSYCNDVFVGVELLLCASIPFDKALYLIGAGAAGWQIFFGIAPAFALALIVGGIYFLSNLIRKRWVRRAIKIAVFIVTFLAAFFTAVSAVGFLETGSIPRLQQFSGLTWDIIGPSVIPMVVGKKYIILATVLAGLVLIAFFTELTARLKPSYLLSCAGVVALYSFSAVSVGAINGHPAENGTFYSVLVSKFFRQDIDIDAYIDPAALAKEKRFFRAYHERLRDSNGLAPLYRHIFPKLKGKNVILLVLESVRAKDVPLYGGSADMPNMVAAKAHMVLLENLYAQDPRSTKAYPQLDMGRFSLLSWDSYSNNIPWMFPEDGLAHRLNRLGYETFSDVDGDRAYDHHKAFQEHHGYQHVLYRQALNPGSPNADDLRMLQRVRKQLHRTTQPFYMMLWPIQTHHPYGREYWADKAGWLSRHPEGIRHEGKKDHGRYLNALHEADDWFGRLLRILKAEGKYESTVLIVIGDHGEAFQEHEPGNVFHGNGVYEESTHIAGFIYSPAIEGFHVDSRYLRELDIAATIYHLATSSRYIFNDGRSLFNAYAHEMPIYLFNSWAGAAGIIKDGFKLWKRERPNAPIHYASMSAIAKDPAGELDTVKGHDAAQYRPLLDDLQEWEAAMKSRTARLLVRKADDQPPIKDVLRIYCDDGRGFREGLKDVADMVGRSAVLTLPIDKDCRAIRIAPIQRTEVPSGKHLVFNIHRLDVMASDKNLDLDDMVLNWSNDLGIISQHKFDLVGASPAFDYLLGGFHHIRRIRLEVSYTWTRFRGER